MPTYEYEAMDPGKGCARCRQPFDVVQRMSDPPLATCPACGAAVRKLISRPSIGPSASGFDHHAKSKGFHKLKRLGKGEYEKIY